MGVCCYNQKPQIEDDTKVVVVNIFKDFNKEPQDPIIRQSKVLL